MNDYKLIERRLIKSGGTMRYIRGFPDGFELLKVDSAGIMKTKVYVNLATDERIVELYRMRGR